jgi:hypothetical protein
MRDKLEIAGMLREIALLRLHDEEQFRTQRTNERGPRREAPPRRSRKVSEPATSRSRLAGSVEDPLEPLEPVRFDGEAGEGALIAENDQRVQIGIPDLHLA